MGHLPYRRHNSHTPRHQHTAHTVRNQRDDAAAAQSTCVSSLRTEDRPRGLLRHRCNRAVSLSRFSERFSGSAGALVEPEVRVGLQQPRHRPQADRQGRAGDQVSRRTQRDDAALSGPPCMPSLWCRNQRHGALAIWSTLHGISLVPHQRDDAAAV